MTCFVGKIDPFSCFQEAKMVLTQSVFSIPPKPAPLLTLAGAIIMTAKIAMNFFGAGPPLKLADMLVFVASWIGYSCATQAFYHKKVHQASKKMKDQVAELEENLESEKNLTETKQQEIERLQKNVTSLEEQVSHLEESAQTYTNANDLHASLIEEQNQLLERKKIELAHVEGLLEARKEELLALQEEHRASLADTKKLNDQIFSRLKRQEDVLDEGNRLFDEFLEKVEEMPN